MSILRSPIPRPALVYALAGLLPFLACTVLVFLRGDDTQVAVTVEALYAAVILSFLGGARWGIEIPRQVPRAGVITLTTHAASGLGILAVLFVACGVWDVTSRDVPDWYPRLRIALTLCVVILLGVSALGVLLG